MDVIIVTNGTPEEITALALGVQKRRSKSMNENDLASLRDSIKVTIAQAVGQQRTDKTVRASERESLIREYERRLALLKSGASPGDVVVLGAGSLLDLGS